ncbi:COX15/CtaA family protein [Phenylobacterium sp.]|uniref:COX15/CtaA family protein n=1 Tax=Phenylobacterium sp. TaxID=1871053 RepID=UPI002F40DEF0
MIALSRASTPAASRAAGLGGRSRAVAVWLFTVAGFVGLMVVVGGATRLTGSGLSITEWKPLTGALPPLSDQAWADLFARYRATSQYRLINQGISLGEFQVLFWWEWAHRLLGRLVGIVFALPLVSFLALRQVPRRLVGRCFLLLALGGLQGLVGWWMVESGLEGRASVAPERLAVHLGLALVLLSALVWTALDAWAGNAPETSGRTAVRARGGRVASALFAAGVFVQCLMGALVAGNGGGRVDTDWPLMGGRAVPSDYWQGGLWATVAHGRSAGQFDHRLFAYLLLGAGVFLLVGRLRAREGSRDVAVLTAVCVVLLVLQAALGVATLLADDPLSLALAHQANAALLLSVAVGLAWRSARSAGNILPRI